MALSESDKYMTVASPTGPECANCGQRAVFGDVMTGEFQKAHVNCDDPQLART